MKKYKQLNEQQMQENKKKFGKLVEYSFITKPGDLLLDEDDESGLDVQVGDDQELPQTPQEEPEVNVDVTPEPALEVPVEAPQTAPAPTQLPTQPEEGEEIEVDVTQLTQDQEKVNDIVTSLASQTSEMMNLLSTLTDKFDQSIQKTETEMQSIKAEIEKRNPTPKEVMQKRNTLGNPFTETPEDYWAKKEAEGTYELTDSGKPEKEYELRAADLQDSPTNVYKSFGMNDEETNQTFKSVMGF